MINLFTAEATLYNSRHHYHSHAGSDGSKGNVIPAQIGTFLFDFNCPGTTENCISTWCSGLIGQQRAQCVATCRQTSVCGPCNCNCGPDCTRSCTQRCCRTVVGPPFRQICCNRSCRPFPDTFLGAF